MYVSPIKTQNYNIQNKSQNFKSLVSVPKASVKPLCGTFSNKITVQLSTIMKAYKEIKSKVTRLTPEGLAFIAENYPDITIGEGLTFHKCGENNSSILVRLAESFEYEGLARIIERKGNSTWSERIVLNSFLLEVPYKALKNEEANKQKLYPKERIYLTSEELKEQNYEQNLETVLDKLDTAMLFFRQYLRKIDDRFLTVLEGVLSGSILSTLKSINVLEESIEKSLLALPKNLRVDARKSYPNTKLITGLTSPAFNNDDVYITYHAVTPQGIDNMRRLNVFDAKGNIIDSYAVTTEGKMVSNLNKKFSTYFPKKISYFDASQIKEEQNEPSFEKYLSIYHRELKALDIHIKDYLAKRLAIMENTPLELEQCIQNNISNILDLSQGISKKLKKISPSEVVELKKMVKGLYFPPGRRGITFDDFKGDKRVYFLKVNSRIHSNLCRMSIIDSAGNEKVFLIKEIERN